MMQEWLEGWLKQIALQNEINALAKSAQSNRMRNDIFFIFHLFPVLFFFTFRHQSLKPFI
ncbi:hypothetical protein [Bacteroides sp. 224]|uniref:hypothetical protein n=1 Tax=Bacteroides sp. 224 TaxID=2302936 RepID=UPI00351B3E95